MWIWKLSTLSWKNGWLAVESSGHQQETFSGCVNNWWRLRLSTVFLVDGNIVIWCFSQLSMHCSHLNNIVPDCWSMPPPHPCQDSVGLGWSLIIRISNVFPGDADDGHTLRTCYVISENIYFLWLGGSTYCVLKKNWAGIGVKQIIDTDHQIFKYTYTQSEHLLRSVGCLGSECNSEALDIGKLKGKYSGIETNYEEEWHHDFRCPWWILEKNFLLSQEIPVAFTQSPISSYQLIGTRDLFKENFKPREW